MTFLPNLWIVLWNGPEWSTGRPDASGGQTSGMDDADLEARINRLVEEEHELDEGYQQ